MTRIVALTAVLLVALPATVRAEESDEGGGSGTSSFLRAIMAGHRLYRNHEYVPALRAYREAQSERPDDALATFLVGCAQRATSDLAGALESFQRAVELAGAGQDALHLHALWNVAMVREAQRDWEAARQAWRAYITFAESHRRARTFEASARQRLGAITSVEELDAAYEPVRERIAADRPAARSR